MDIEAISEHVLARYFLDSTRRDRAGRRSPYLRHPFRSVYQFKGKNIWYTIRPNKIEIEISFENRLRAE